MDMNKLVNERTPVDPENIFLRPFVTRWQFLKEVFKLAWNKKQIKISNISEFVLVLFEKTDEEIAPFRKRVNKAAFGSKKSEFIGIPELRPSAPIGISVAGTYTKEPELPEFVKKQKEKRIKRNLIEAYEKRINQMGYEDVVNLYGEITHPASDIRNVNQDGVVAAEFNFLDGEGKPSVLVKEK